MSEACEEKNRGNDLRFIELTRDLPIEQRVEVSLRIGKWPTESTDRYVARRGSLHETRIQEWNDARRFGQSVLPFVEAQKGLCGDPKEDPFCKGCGTYLYGFPVTAVHLDHIVSQSRGGSDEPGSLQALCSYCNPRAGSRT